MWYGQRYRCDTLLGYGENALKALASFLASALLFVVAPHVGQCKTPFIVSTQFNATSQSVLTISGTQFGANSPAVYINNIALNIISYTDTQVTVNLPSGQSALAPGTYVLLLVRNGIEMSNTTTTNSATFLVTVGATGPQGPSGPAGPQGLQGSIGSAGAMGPQGQQGIQGPAGPGLVRVTDAVAHSYPLALSPLVLWPTGVSPFYGALWQTLGKTFVIPLTASRVMPTPTQPNFWYQSTDCSGMPYVSANSAVTGYYPEIQLVESQYWIVGTTLFFPSGPTQRISVVSYQSPGGPGGACSTVSFPSATQDVAYPMAAVDLSSDFVPPFQLQVN